MKKFMTRVKSLFDGLVSSTPFGMKKCRYHNIWFTEVCPECEAEKGNRTLYYYD